MDDTGWEQRQDGKWKSVPTPKEPAPKDQMPKEQAPKYEPPTKDTQIEKDRTKEAPAPTRGEERGTAAPSKDLGDAYKARTDGDSRLKNYEKPQQAPAPKPAGNSESPAGRSSGGKGK